MKKWLIAVGALAVLAIIVWASLREGRPKGTEVEVQAAENRTLSSRVKATGEVTPEKKVEISAKVVGEITSLPVVEGQQVQRQQPEPVGRLAVKGFVERQKGHAPGVVEPR